MGKVLKWLISVIVAAHRGDWRNYPENSLAAIDNAIKMGVDIDSFGCTKLLCNISISIGKK